MKPKHAYYITYSVIQSNEILKESRLKLITDASPVELGIVKLAQSLADDNKCSIDAIDITSINYLGTDAKPFTEKLLYVLLIAFSLYQLNILLHHL